MKYLRKFNESSKEEMELLDDYLLEYTDKYKIRAEQDPISIDNTEKIARHKGFYSIKEVSSKSFKVKGFPDHKSGYLVKITFNFRPNKDIESEFKRDMISFINRFCNSKADFGAVATISHERSTDNWPYEYQTSINDIFNNGTMTEYYIAFFR